MERAENVAHLLLQRLFGWLRAVWRPLKGLDPASQLITQGRQGRQKAWRRWRPAVRPLRGRGVQEDASRRPLRSYITYIKLYSKQYM